MRMMMIMIMTMTINENASYTLVRGNVIIELVSNDVTIIELN